MNGSYTINLVGGRGYTGSELLGLIAGHPQMQLGIASSRAQARQLVSHGHIMLNGRKTNIASALVSPGDEVSIRSESMGRPYFRVLRQDMDDRRVPRWLALDTTNVSANILHLPAREDIDVSLNEQLIVEYYSR